MADFDRKYAIIMEHEKEFAHMLASRVLDRPQLSLWMILIPIIFVFYFFQLQKFSTGRSSFAGHYLVSRKRALDEALRAVKSDTNPDITMLASLSDVPHDTRPQQAKVISILVDHYRTLLQSDGDDIAYLITSAYGNLTGFLLFLNSLSNAEKDRDAALKPYLKKTQEGIDDIVSRIETLSEQLRREVAEKIFS